MAGMQVKTQIAQENIRLMLLAYGIGNPYRVIAQEEIFQSLSHIDREKIKETLDQLAGEGLVTKFSSRYCFNKPMPAELGRSVDRRITPSGTVITIR